MTVERRVRDVIGLRPCQKKPASQWATDGGSLKFKELPIRVAAWLLERNLPQIPLSYRNQVERHQHSMATALSASQRIEVRSAILAADDDFTIDQE